MARRDIGWMPDMGLCDPLPVLPPPTKGNKQERDPIHDCPVLQGIRGKNLRLLQPTEVWQLLHQIHEVATA